MTGVLDITTDALAGVTGGGAAAKGTDWRQVRQAVVVGASVSAPFGAGLGGTLGMGAFSIPGAAVGALAGAGIGAVTAGVQSWAMQRWMP